MLTIEVPGLEMFDEEREIFVTSPSTTLVLEHSLVSLTRWESKWEKSFLSTEEKTTEQTYSYIQCMSVNEEEIPPEVMARLDNDIFRQINNYIEAKHTATWFSDLSGKARSREVITNELIYHWMVALQIPFEPAENWHLNRLFTLIRVISEKNAPKKKMNTNELAQRNRELNAQRKREMQTTG